MERKSFLIVIAAWLAGCAQRLRSASSSLHGMMQRGMMGGRSGGMMNVSQHDMSVYTEMFDHHTEIRRRVEHLANGIQTITESDNPRISELLREHVPAMWAHVSAREEVRCMSNSLPTIFRNASKYLRRLDATPKGVVVSETSDDPLVLAALRRHADEVSGFVTQGMPAMMRGMMGR